MAQEHQDYIRTKVNPTLENLVTQVLLERPDNPVPFMISWLSTQTQMSAPGQPRAGEAERLRDQIAEINAEIRQLESQLGMPAEGEGGAAGSQASEEDDDEVEEPPPVDFSAHRKQRQSVSAEAYGDWNKQQAFVPPNNPKTDEQKQRLTPILANSFLFSSLEKEQQNIVVNAMLEKPVKKGERVIQEGDDGDCMYVVEDGSFECIKTIDGQEKVLKTCETSDLFGELALLYNCPRAASVQASREGVLWSLDRETFNHIVRDGAVKKRERHEEFLRSVPLLETLGKYERSQLADALQRLEVNAGQDVIRQEEEGDRFYIVEQGELCATKKDKPAEVLVTYKAGDYFGELALMKADVRQASIRAKTDSSLLWVDRRTFSALLGGLQELLADKAKDYK